MADHPDRISRWIEGAKRGDVASLEMLLLWNYDQIVRYVRQRFSPADAQRLDAEDIVQHSHQKVFESIDRFRGATDGEFVAWMRRICDTTLMDTRRNYNGSKRSGYRRRYSIDTVRVDGDSSITNIWHDVKTAHPSAVSQVISSEEEEQLGNAIAELPVDDRELIELRYVNQLSTQDIADALDVSVSTVFRRSREVIDRIRRRLNTPQDTS